MSPARYAASRSGLIFARSITPAPPWIAMATGCGAAARTGKAPSAALRAASVQHRAAVIFRRDMSSLKAAMIEATPVEVDLKVKPASPQRISSVLVANRGEIAIRVMRAASELGLRTVAVYSQEDRFSLHRTKADESYLVGAGRSPLAAYLDIEDILRIARAAQVDAIHPGYGFLAENPEFARACADAGIRFIGPEPATLAAFGNKVSARSLAQSAGVAVMPASEPLPADPAACAR